MARISTKDFYFSKFGGYCGLQSVLVADIRTIQNLADGELALPGTYSEVIVNEITSYGHNQYSVEFTQRDGSYIHLERCYSTTPWYVKLYELAGLNRDVLGLEVDIILIPTSLSNRLVAGKLMSKFYLLNSSSQILFETNSAKGLMEYCRIEGLLDLLKGVQINDVRPSQTSKSS